MNGLKRVAAVATLLIVPTTTAYNALTGWNSIAITAARRSAVPGSATASACPDPNSVLIGSYGWQTEALLAFGSGPLIGDSTPLVTVGHLTFDGNGSVVGAHVSNAGGELFQIVDSGTYSVNSDCATGTVFLPIFNMSIVITGGGREIEFVSTRGGHVNSGTLRLIATAPCSASTLTGTSYAYATHGLVAPGLGSAEVPRIGSFVPFSNAGQILFQADGGISGVDNMNLGGVFIPGRPIAGTYTVNSDCTGTTTMTIAGQDRSWSFVILQNANQVNFIATPRSVVWGGTLTKD